MIVELDHRLFLAQDYAIINPMQVGREAYSDLSPLRLQPKGLERHEHILPLLVDLKSLEAAHRIELLERTLSWAQRHHMPLFSALFSSEHTYAQVFSELLRRTVLQREGGQRVWLRYYDPRVFRHLQWLLDDEQLATLMGSAQTWLGFDPLCRRWHQWTRPNAAKGLYLRLDSEQWQAVSHLEALNRCLRDLAEMGQESGDDIAKRVLEGLLVARRQGLAHFSDAALFALQQLEYGPEFALFPAVALRLQRAREQGISYSSACRGLSNDDLACRSGVA
ncbi:DUF4123 domain-containing protein [Luteimonas sp. YGD11-2]|uniref:DUF4123 domain-containing protein n=1 Tax=Luteimonas sp. YGD11-2 TaxID=2508168 RepID=UPI0013E9119B|nr:DUF4123 domain-containing protein [Luteimonas sp. YGD11-2]